ncbi:MAG: hypothetical protein E7160_01130 [Firmicutes bacterium]|nr:hypothetical protein [Bacillota bacterium]
MNFDLKYNDLASEFLLCDKSRKIKLRKASFSSVVSKWTEFVNEQAANVTAVNDSFQEAPQSDVLPIPTINVDETETKKVEEQITKLPIGIPSLADKIVLVDTNWGDTIFIKRRALALNKTMYTNMIKNTGASEENYTVPEINNDIDIDEEEIKQAVKDAFEQISFNKADVEEEVMISPEEVSSTVTDTDTTDNNYMDISFDINTPKEEQEENEVAVEEPIFKFENINFDKINPGFTNNESTNDVEESKFIISDYSMNIDDNSSEELKDLLEAAKELKNQALEQERKTNDAHKLAMEKQARKEQAKADFIAYKNAMEEELNRKKKEEEEALEQARQDEEFTSALVNIMNGN